MPLLWKLKPMDETMVEAVVHHTQWPLPLARALALRGFAAPDRIESFLHPRLADLSDPFLLPDMHKAVARLWHAIHAAEPITVFGDYDVDGVTSSALLTRVLLELGGRVQSFIPDRLNEGYGLSCEALERCLADHKSTLVVTVDCGTNSVDSIAYAQAQGVDVIVTDHHEPDSEIAAAFALVNPKLGQNPAQEILSGAGVAFKLAHALLKTGREQGHVAAKEIKLRNYLDLAALGTAADLVPLIGDNRIIVRHGLTTLDRTRWEGLRALKAVAGMRGTAETYHLGFQLGPRINAAGRIGQPMQALRLLTTNDPGEAREIASLLDRTNLERRKLEHEMAEQAFAEIDSYFNPEHHFGLVVAREGWHPGVVGIVASRVARHYNRPAVVLGIDSAGKIRGSCRSIEAFDVLAGLRACEAFLGPYGGHKMAAGAAVLPGKLADFSAAFNTAAATQLRSRDLSPVLLVDAEVTGEELDWKFLESLKQLSPFGQHNPEPIWVLRGATLVGQPRVVGQTHLKLTLSAGAKTLEAIAFSYPLERLPTGQLDLAFTLKENTWQGRSSVQLQIKAIRLAEKEPILYAK